MGVSLHFSILYPSPYIELYTSGCGVEFRLGKPTLVALMVECIFHDKTNLYNFFWYLLFQNHITIIIIHLMIEIEDKWSDYKRPYRT